MPANPDRVERIKLREAERMRRLKAQIELNDAETELKHAEAELNRSRARDLRGQEPPQVSALRARVLELKASGRTTIKLSDVSDIIDS